MLLHFQLETLIPAKDKFRFWHTEWLWRIARYKNSDERIVLVQQR